MTEAAHILQKLRALIGRQAVIRERPCELIEVLEDGPQLVLRCLGECSVIQPDQYGEAHRRVPQTIAVPVFDLEGKALNPFLVELGLWDSEPD